MIDLSQDLSAAPQLPLRVGLPSAYSSLGIATLPTKSSEIPVEGDAPPPLLETLKLMVWYGPAAARSPACAALLDQIGSLRSQLTNLEKTVLDQNEELAQVKRRYLTDEQLKASYEQQLAEAAHLSQAKMLEATEGFRHVEQQHREEVQNLRSAAQAADRKHAEEKMQLRLSFDSKLQAQATMMMPTAQGSIGSKPANGNGGGGGTTTSTSFCSPARPPTTAMDITMPLLVIFASVARCCALITRARFGRRCGKHWDFRRRRRRVDGGHVP